MKLAPSLFSLVWLVVASASHAGTYPAPKAVEAAVAPAPDATSTVLGLGLNTNDNMTEGSAFLVQPLWDTLGRHGTMGGSLFFAEPYFTWGEEGQLSGSIGLGFRHLFSNEPIGGDNRVAGLLAEGLFVGANVFADYQHTRVDSDLWQLGIGVEAGVRYLELRANYYIPLTDDSVGSYDVTEFAPTSSGGRPAIRATTRTIDIIEEPMEGWDAELALLIPGLDKYFDVRLIGGYYSFETNATGSALLYSTDVEGWKAGVEVRPVPAVVLAGMWYQDENLVEDNWLVSVRLEVPLGKPASESFTPRRRHLQERLLEPVHRQNASINTGVSLEPSGVKNTTTLTSAQQAQRFLADLKGWGAVYTGASKGPSSSSSSNHTTGSTLKVSNSSGSGGSLVVFSNAEGISGSGSLSLNKGGGTPLASVLASTGNGSVTVNDTNGSSLDRAALASTLVLASSVNTFSYNHSNNNTPPPAALAGTLTLANGTSGLVLLPPPSNLTLNTGIIPTGGGTLQLTNGGNLGGFTITGGVIRNAAGTIIGTTTAGGYIINTNPPQP
ncbi:inverse autotransporter-like protein with beta domain [Roseimicrobium gellanilyticum]|uniref:Inverse autotransporter-like protein with beta domain n=1 Tax=Roseimicrobium gellanilyticum TaxID=748857 RepID=A0A366HDF3_9BACT|nr:inverse autotransporter beta domain-containing protein [Roseimicrobium gellanilyticum]RBP39755.1 inverse autotransporter-like protein with beta domain [Roseimicrobium gellanilyticum]